MHCEVEELVGLTKVSVDKTFGENNIVIHCPPTLLTQLIHELGGGGEGEKQESGSPFSQHLLPLTYHFCPSYLRRNLGSLSFASYLTTPPSSLDLQNVNLKNLNQVLPVGSVQFRVAFSRVFIFLLAVISFPPPPYLFPYYLAIYSPLLFCLTHLPFPTSGHSQTVMLP